MQSKSSGKKSNISNGLSVVGELLSLDRAVEIARAHYRIEASAEKLAGEKDSNFKMTSEDGSEYLLKVVNPGENPNVTNMHTMALLHVERFDPGMPVQRIIRTVDGLSEFRLSVGRKDERTVRMVTFTKGALQRSTPHTPLQRRNAGAMLARLQLALRTFEHPADNHELTWDLKHALQLRGLLPAIDDGEHRDKFGQRLDVFERDVYPLLPELRSQVVHNDLNSDNIVVDPSGPDIITGIIDFGDMVRTPVVIDAAVGAAYQLTEAEDPLAAACDFLAGFNAIQPLEEVEIDLLYTLIVTRMVMRIAITEWRAVRFPENRTYILRNTPQAWRQFQRLSLISNQLATDHIRAVCVKRSN